MKAVVVLLAIASAARAQPPAAMAPAPIAAAGVDERVGAQLPLDTKFRSARGGELELRAVFDGERPVLLVLAYARCTMLCSLVLRGVSEVARELSGDHRLVLVGLDDRETLDEAARKRATLVAGGSDWTYLVGTRASIDAVARALGFRYAWDPRTEQYAHPAVIFAIAPDGRVARYVHGVTFDRDDVSAALADARARRFVSSQAAEVLRCFRFDPASRRAGARVERVLQIGAVIIFSALIATIASLIVSERRRARLS